MPVGDSTRQRRAPAAGRVEGTGEMLALIRDGRAHTIGDLAVVMNMARSTVAQRVGQLLSAGLVVSAPAGDDDVSRARGRRPAVLQFNPASGVVLVAQLGMTGARVAVTDLAGDLLGNQFTPFPIESGPEAVVDHLEEQLLGVLEVSGKTRSEVRGVGVGVPSATELAASRVLGEPLPVTWDGFPVAQRLGEAFGAPAFTDHDVNLLALGEQRARWPDTEVVLCVKAGSVIGCGTVVHGEVVSGAQGVAGGIGHLPVPGDTTPCHCGNVGCLDAVASGRALAAQLRAAGLPVVDARDVATLARNGVPQAEQAIRAAGRRIGEVLAHAVNLLNPGVIAVWGYLAEAEDHLLAGVRETVYQRSLPTATRSLQLVRAQLSDGLAGAATMVLAHVLAPDVLDEHLSVRALGGEVAPGRTRTLGRREAS